MSDDLTPHPRNVPGPFYILNGCCTACMVMHSVTTHLLGYDDEDHHCYVKCQPDTTTEVFQAIQAAAFSDLGCLRYRGADAEIQTRLVEIGAGDICDHPVPPAATPVLRSHVTFSVSTTIAAAEIAAAFEGYLAAQQLPYIVSPAVPDGDSVRI